MEQIWCKSSHSGGGWICEKVKVLLELVVTCVVAFCSSSPHSLESIVQASFFSSRSAEIETGGKKPFLLLLPFLFMCLTELARPLLCRQYQNWLLLSLSLFSFFFFHSTSCLSEIPPLSLPWLVGSEGKNSGVCKPCSRARQSTPKRRRWSRWRAPPAFPSLPLPLSLSFTFPRENVMRRLTFSSRTLAAERKKRERGEREKERGR